MTAALYQPPPCDAERERIRELARYYCLVDRPPSTKPDTQVPQGDQHPDDSPRLSSDITLNALAQLGVLRFRCNRSFVSIIDGANQHIIAEATGSVSLRHVDRHQPNDGIYLGTRTLDLLWGVCPHTIKLFTGRDCSYTLDTANVTANRSRYIIRDFTKEDAFKDRPYVVGWPHMRFYAEVPLRSPTGHILGSYCIVDDKPWLVFGDEEVAALQEIADAIADHLETIRISHCHRRTESLVKSLTTFVKDQTQFDPAETYNSASLRPETMMSQSPSDDEELIETLLSFPKGDLGDVVDPLILEHQSPSDATGELSSLFSKVVCSEQTEISISPQGHESFIPSIPPSLTQNRRDSGSDIVSAGDDVSTETSKVPIGETGIAEGILKIFARASMLLRDSMDLEGVLFLDACRCNSGVAMASSTGNWEPLPSTANPEFFVDPYPSPLDMPGVGSLSKVFEKDCTALGSALKTESPTPINISEKLLNLLIASFPRGQIFNLKDYTEDTWVLSGNSYYEEADPVREICNQLSKYLPDANCVLFSPLWDWNKSRWLAGTLVWTQDDYRTLSVEELHYFTAFGDSIISEVARVDWAMVQKSKSDFMSCVSHELRSPLHGILGSVELLATASLLPQQYHPVKMIEACGMTLLDTLNHLLDFSKINILSTVDDPEHTTSDGSTASLTSVFELDSLVEEVVNVQYAGRKAPQSASHLADPCSPYNAQCHVPESDDAEMTVIVRIEEPETWKIQSIPGAWRRIVMNLLGNSLKWTKTGFVEIALSKVRRRSDQLAAFVQLSVTDTGRGIAPEFLRHKLFSPFAQENSLSEGLGLGMSIVHQLVTSLDGHINVRSEVGIGTQVDVYIPAQMLQPESTGGLNRSSLGGQPSLSALPKACLIGFNGYPELTEPPTGILPAEAKRKLAIQSCITTVLRNEPTWDLSLIESIENARGDIAIFEEVQFSELIAGGRLAPEELERTGFKFLIVLESKTHVLPRIEGSNVVRVSQPFSFSKFSDAIASVCKLQEEAPRKSNSQMSHNFTLKRHESPQDMAITIPRATPDTHSSDLPMPPVQPNIKDPIHLHLLIVDDNDINLKILVTFTRKIGCTYDTASDGLIAYNKYKESCRRYDLVLMDISMPVMDGILSTTKIRQHEKEKGLSPSRIMAVTGVASADMQQRAHAAGIDDYLVKPVSLHALKKVISSM